MYATDDLVVGVAALPIDGSPHGIVGLVGASGPITSLAVAAPKAGSFRGSFYTADGPTVVGWSVDESALRRAALGPDPTTCTTGTGTGTGTGTHTAAVDSSSNDPFVASLAGGAGGEQYAALCDTFAFAQIHSQGEASSAPRLSTAVLPLAQLPTLVRGLGLYPTQWEESLLVAEATAGAAAKGGPEARYSVDLADAVRLFVNHRAVRAPCKEDVEKAMAVVAGSHDREMEWGVLSSLLATQGEPLADVDLVAIASTLADGDADAGAALLTRALSAQMDAYSPDAPMPAALMTQPLSTHSKGLKVANANARAPLPHVSQGPLLSYDLLNAADIAAIMSLE